MVFYLLASKDKVDNDRYYYAASAVLGTIYNLLIFAVEQLF
jgi:hypothetical protein